MYKKRQKEKQFGYILYSLNPYAASSVLRVPTELQKLGPAREEASQFPPRQLFSNYTQSGFGTLVHLNRH